MQSPGDESTLTVTDVYEKKSNNLVHLKDEVQKTDEKTASETEPQQVSEISSSSCKSTSMYCNGDSSGAIPVEDLDNHVPEILLIYTLL